MRYMAVTSPQPNFHALHFTWDHPGGSCIVSSHNKHSGVSLLQQPLTLIKPQRPVRALRIHDENAPIANPIAAKTLHQRNKSTPALSTLMQGGAVRGGVKRTAFADVSNTARTAQAAKDDSAISGKGSYDNVKVSMPQAQDLVKPTSTALLRPAHRPLTSKPSTSTVNIPTKPAASDKPSISQLQSAATRKVFPKRSEPVLKDAVSGQVSDSASSNIIENAPAVTSSTIQQVLAQTQLAEPIRPSAPKQLTAESVPSAENVNPAQLANIDLASVISNQGYYGSAPDQLSENNYLLALEQQATALEAERSGALASQHAAILPGQPAQNFVDEEDYYYEEDDYSTAKSIPMRGDNTTGGVTTLLAPRYTAKVQQEIAAAKMLVDSSRTPEDIEDDQWDTSMVAEYGDEIFSYMRTLEDRLRPNPHYMDNQTECQWSMRAVLMDWLVQVHHRFQLLPETLFLSINYVDRFLSCKIVSLGKLQLVGATAIFVAAKYEEVNCPSVQEIVYMVDNGYNVDEILKAERFMLTMLQFELGWPGPMSFLRRISKADDYDLETRTLAKYFLEVTIMDERFVGCVPSFTAAGAHCLARLMLRKGDWVSTCQGGVVFGASTNRVTDPGPCVLLQLHLQPTPTAPYRYGRVL